MSSQVLDPPTVGITHPVAEFATRLNTRLDDLAEQSLLAMSEPEQRDTLVALARAEAKQAALRLRLLAHADATGACTTTGSANPAGWLVAQTRQTRRTARADLTLARRLESLPVLAAGMSTGVVNGAQARAVVMSLDRLPATGEFAVSPEQRAHAEAHLVGLCASHDADAVEALGRRIFEVIAPEAAEVFEGKLLEAEEAKAARKTSFEMHLDDQGIAHGRFRIPRLHAEMMRKAICALTNPVRHGSAVHSPIDPHLPTPVQEGIAFAQIIEAIAAHWLPTHGGVGATVVVTMTLEQLLADLDDASLGAGVCDLDTGAQISAGQARRLACTAGIIPMVLGSPSVVLDAGATSRFFTEKMRLALAQTQKTCTAEHCDVPAAMCHAHHDTPFSAGGPTSLTNGRLLCGHHHRRTHDPAYRHETLPDGTIRYHRRT